MSESLKVKGYKSFSSNYEEQGFDDIKKINVLIGKNNSGKSALLDLIKAYAKNESLNDGSIFIKHSLIENDVIGIGNGTSGGGIPGPGDHNAYLRSFLGNEITIQKTPTNQTIPSPAFVQYAINYFSVIADRAISRSIVKGKNVLLVNAERDINPEDSGKGDGVSMLKGNGEFATQILRQLYIETSIGVISKVKDSLDIQNLFFETLQKIIKPEIEFIGISMKQGTGTNTWEIYFETPNHDFIALSKMGSGMKTILLVLINLIIKPRVDGKNISSYIFILEELENNLHPAIQRRLYNYISEYSGINEGVLFFISTHSNVVIDIFSRKEDSQLILITQDNGVSKAKTLLDTHEEKLILEELDFRASDLLQTNGIVWVEGPSDRTYLNKWLQLKFPELREGTHYSIMFYGGRLLSHLSFRTADPSEINNFIDILKINRNAFVMIDRDGKNLGAKINNTKSRILVELGEKSCWITNGIEIENYLNGGLLTKWLRGKHGYTGNPLFLGKFDKIDSKIPSSSGVKYSDLKVKYSQEIAEFIEVSDIDSDLKLKHNIEELGLLIKKWNKLH